ncbi:MAG: YitT family protein [Christensenellaceae bacterium]|jgi:uncharacterized membrane-anchored protein YitT (DUF2179 family)|nr:YitT family protein [Christensenellaceae bacterium]
MSKKPALKGAALGFLGLILMGCAYAFFFMPNQIAPGGVTGLATILHLLFGFPVGLTAALINIPLFVMGWRSMGRGFAIRSLVAMLLLSALLDGLPQIALTTDKLLAVGLGGGLLGVGLSLVVRGNATTGGSDLAAAMLSRLFPGLGFGNLLFFIEACVVGFSALTLGPELALYAVVAILLSTKIVDAAQSGLREGRLFFIVSERPGEISRAVMDELHHGVTQIEAKGAYSGASRPLLFCVVERPQVYSLRRLVAGIDPHAFMVLTSANEILGEGFAHILPPKGSGMQ